MFREYGCARVLPAAGALGADGAGAAAAGGVPPAVYRGAAGSPLFKAVLTAEQRADGRLSLVPEQPPLPSPPRRQP